MKKTAILVLALMLVVLLANLVLAQEAAKPTEGYKDWGSRLLEFLYSIAHYIGVGIVEILNTIIPNVPMPEGLIDPIGFLALLTIFLVVAQIARKLAWIVVVAGWVLILARIALVIIQGG